MPRRNSNALRGGPRQTRDYGQLATAADEFDDLDYLITQAPDSSAARPGTAADFSAVPARVYAKGRRNG